MECKGARSAPHTGRCTVLIETSWNVKMVPNRFTPAALVLIETSWNVKYDRGAWHVGVNYGINRNIVECKDVRLAHHLPPYVLVLIETSWNVKC